MMMMVVGHWQVEEAVRELHRGVHHVLERAHRAPVRGRIVTPFAQSICARFLLFFSNISYSFHVHATLTDRSRLCTKIYRTLA